jgi:hypothetical protein
MAINPGLEPAELTPWLRRELLAAGESDRSIARHVRVGDWCKVRWGAYIGANFWGSLSPEDQHRVRARAVLKNAHPATVLSHISAAVELGAPTYAVDLGVVHVTRLDGHPGRRHADVVHHVGVLPESSVLSRNGVRLVNGNRAAFEVMTIADVEPSLVVVDGLLHSREADSDGLRELVKSHEHWPHSLKTHVTLRLADGRRESGGESRFHNLCWKQSLPCPEPQVPVFDERGQLVARCDAAWPRHGVFVEVDGRSKYTTLLRPGQSAADVMLAQQRREELICRLTGWVCVRISWADLGRPVETARRIRRLLESRRAAG